MILLPDLYTLLKIINKVAFHTVDDLEELLRIRGRQSLFFSSLVLGRKKRVPHMIGVRKSLNISVVSYGNSGHAPFICSSDQILALGYTVHVAHFRMAVQFNSLQFRVILSLFDNRRDLHDSLQ